MRKASLKSFYVNFKEVVAALDFLSTLRVFLRGAMQRGSITHLHESRVWSKYES
jgi:hypothetical protein